MVVSDGNPDGPKLGVPVGESLGARDGGIVIGGMLGASDGAAVGLRLGDPDGARVGDNEGCSELYAASLLGASVGDNDGNPDGAKLGVPVGDGVGARERSSVVESMLGAIDGAKVCMRMPMSEGEEDCNSDGAMLGKLVDGNMMGEGAGEPGRWLEFPVVGSGVGEFVRVLDGCGVGELLGG